MGNCIKADTTSTRYQGYTSYPTGTSDPLLREEETDNVSVYTALGDSKSFLIVHTYAFVHTQLFVNYRDRGYYKICKPPDLFYVIQLDLSFTLTSPSRFSTHPLV